MSQKMIIGFWALLLLAYTPQLLALQIPNAANAHGKYSQLRQTLNCPSDRANYGDYRDYGYWGGGAWCGQTGKSGYWVWVHPNWYVWSAKASAAPAKPAKPAFTPAPPPQASAQGKYSQLLQTLNCPSDRANYGDYRDYGYWGGGAWCGQTGKPGYWVWVHPNWYVWARN